MSLKNYDTRKSSLVGSGGTGPGGISWNYGHFITYESKKGDNPIYFSLSGGTLTSKIIIIKHHEEWAQRVNGYTGNNDGLNSQNTIQL